MQVSSPITRVALLVATFVLTVASSSTFVSKASAVPVLVINPSFEDDVYADAGYSYSDPIFGWTRSGSQVTVWNPAASLYTQSGVIPHGDQVMVVDPAGSYVTQLLSETLSAGATYTLTVGIGNRIGGSFGGYEIQLRAGGVILAQDINSVVPGDDEFLDAVTTFVTPFSHAQLGQPLEIRLLRSGITGSTEFDLVRLDALAHVPEPGSLLLTGLGVLGLAIRRRKRNCNRIALTDKIQS